MAQRNHWIHRKPNRKSCVRENIQPPAYLSTNRPEDDLRRHCLNTANIVRNCTAATSILSALVSFT